MFKNIHKIHFVGIGGIGMSGIAEILLDQDFIGDTGSLALGGAFGILAVLIKKELFIPLLGGVFFMETISVITQRVYFKYTKKKYGEGKRVFKMAPIHHHFEMMGLPEPMIVVRFYIVAIILAILSLVSFKIR